MDTMFKLYAHLPIPLQNKLCSYRGYQLDNQRYLGGYEEHFQTLLKSDGATADEIIRYKEAETAQMLEYAYRHCPFYRQSFKDAGLTPQDFKGMDDLQKFPILKKEDVRRYWMGMISDEANPKEMIAYHTSGSTGKALDFYWTRESLQFYWATVWRGRARMGIHKGDSHLNFTGKLVVPLSQNKPPYWRYNSVLNQYMLNMQHMAYEKVPSIVHFLNESDAKFIVGYPSIVYSFARMVEELGLNLTKIPRCMFPSAEKLYDYQREQIMRVFPGMQIREHYGFSENAASASKCRLGHYHEDWEMGHLELNSPVPVEEGMTGVMLATGFKNKAMPFIRYEIGDTATFSPKLCTCGLQSQVIVDIEGRNEDYVITPEGTRIMRFDYIFKEAKDAKECQIVQREVGAIIIRIVRRDSYTTASEKVLEDAVHSMISPTMNVSFEYVDEIPRTRAGKFRAVVSERA